MEDKITDLISFSNEKYHEFSFKGISYVKTCVGYEQYTLRLDKVSKSP